MKYLIANANIVNEGRTFKGSVLIREKYIEQILEHETTISSEQYPGYIFINAEDKILMPGVIDDQVHFREPGLTHKADIYTESKAAVAGGITSFMEMPNTIPNTLTQTLLEEKYKLGSEKSLANYSFYMGSSNDNLSEIVKTNPATVCGVKIFMGSSTGNMLVDNRDTLEGIFRESPCLVAVHCEDENTIRKNTSFFRKIYGENIPIYLHPVIRSEEACFKSSSLAVELAEKYNTRLHILHISTAKETNLFRNDIPLSQKKITAEVCVHHLWFNSIDYTKKGNYIKWNPAVKTNSDRDGLFQALLNNQLDVVATDHAPHTKAEKQNTYFKAPSGGPLVQHSLPVMIEFYHQHRISLEQIVQKMCHAPAECFRIEKRGYIRPGYYADLVIVDLNTPWTVSPENILYKCGWSPFEDVEFKARVIQTFVNGHPVFDNGTFDESERGMRLTFDR